MKRIKLNQSPGTYNWFELALQAQLYSSHDQASALTAGCVCVCVEIPTARSAASLALRQSICLRRYIRRRANHHSSSARPCLRLSVCLAVRLRRSVVCHVTALFRSEARSERCTRLSANNKRVAHVSRLRRQLHRSLAAGTPPSNASFIAIYTCYTAVCIRRSHPAWPDVSSYIARWSFV